MKTETLLVKDQKKSEFKEYIENGARFRITARLRYDDECGNGHNSFSITGDIDEWRGGKWRDYSGGCIHDEIEKHFPQHIHLIKWHLFDSTGPMHYLANTLYLAGDRDCWGKLKGEIKSYAMALQFGDFPILYQDDEKFVKWLRNKYVKAGFPFMNVKARAIAHINGPKDTYKFADKWTIGGYAELWHECPFDSKAEARAFLKALQTYTLVFVETPDAWGEGKARELDSARRAAVWPDATDAELCAPDLKEKLLARLPALIAEFKKDMEDQGFVF